MQVINLEHHHRLLNSEEDWLEYLNDFSYIETSDHSGEPENFPCVVSTKYDYAEDVFYHRFFYKARVSDYFTTLDAEIWVHSSKNDQDDECETSFDWRNDYVNTNDDGNVLDFSENEE